MKKVLFILLVLPLMTVCSKKGEEKNVTMFRDDVEFLQKYTQVILLQDGPALLAVAPELQGRVMTSSADGEEGLSFGWINRELIASGENNKQINAFGGEDRFWLGPEGGQFSIFFDPGTAFDLEHWRTPEPINEIAYAVVDQGNDFVHFQQRMQLVNYSNATFVLELNRLVRLVDEKNVNARFGLEFPPDLKMVAFESQNTISNIGQDAWTKETGLLSIWILGMYNPSPATTIVIPFNTGSEEELGPVVNDTYFGKVPSDRLVIKDDVLFFKGDGEYRSKIGLSPQRAKNVLGSFDEDTNVLTLVSYNKPLGVTDYVNSMWEIQKHPFAGDVVNSYNDGPWGEGKEALGPFYELETSSPAAKLAPGEALTHNHLTVHIQGASDQLDQLAQQILGVALDEIVSAF